MVSGPTTDIRDKNTIGYWLNEEIRFLQPDTDPAFCMFDIDAVMFGIYEPSVSPLHRAGLFHFSDDRKGDDRGKAPLYRSV